MRTNARGVLVVAGLLAAAGLLHAADKEEAVKKELERFQGTWEIVSTERDGNKVPLPEGKKVTITLKGDKYTVKVGDDVVEEGTVVIDPTQNPKTADAKPTTGDKKGQTHLEIFELKGDELRSCVAPDGKPRPTEFSSKNGQELSVLKRVKS